MHDEKSEISGAQCRAGRGLVGMSQGELAKRSRLSVRSVGDFEAGLRTPHALTLEALRATLEAKGVIFIASNGDGPGVRLKKGSPPATPKAANVKPKALIRNPIARKKSK